MILINWVELISRPLKAHPKKMAGDSHYFFVLAKTGLIFCKIPKVTNIASVAYRLFDGFVSVAISMAYGNI
jgi:hypothetical protein